MGLCYILKHGDIEHDSVYKIGRTNTTMRQRLQGYPPDTFVIKSYEVSDCHIIEQAIIKTFSDKYKLFRGNEYFEGDLNSMIVDIEEIVRDFGDKINTVDAHIKEKIQSKVERKKIASMKPKKTNTKSKKKTSNCECGRVYLSESGRYKHRKNCRIYAAVASYEKYRDRNDVLEAEMNEMKTKIKLLTTNLSHSRDKARALTKQLGDSDRRIDDLTSENSKLSMQLYGTMKNELDTKNNQLGALQQ